MEELVTSKWATAQARQSWNDGIHDAKLSIYNYLTDLCTHTTNPKQCRSVCRACIHDLVDMLHKGDNNGS